MKSLAIISLFLAAPTIEKVPAPSTEEAIEQTIKFCRIAYQKFLKGETKFITDALTPLSKEQRFVITLVCAAYGSGYEDGADVRRISKT